MADIFKFEIRREPDAKGGLTRLDRGIELAPSASTRKPNGKSKPNAGPPTWHGAAGRLLPPALIAAHGDHFLIPRPTSEAGAKDSSEQEFEKLHDELFAAYTARDGLGLDTIAGAYLARNAVTSLAAVDPVARAAHVFFEAHRDRAPGAALEGLAKQFPREEIAAHFAAAPALMSRLKGQALAAMVQRTLGAQPFDTLHMIRSLAAYQLLGAGQLIDESRRRPPPNRLIGELIAIDIFLPGWAFDIEVCRWAHDVAGKSARSGRSGAAGGAVSPLRQKLLNIERYDAAMAVHGRDGVDGAAFESACDCSGDLIAICTPPDPCCADINYYIAETLVLRDRVIGYVPSDLAYIENVQAFEKRGLQRTFNRVTEDYSEVETTVTSSEEHDNQVTEKFSLQKEIESQFKASADATAEYTGTGYKVEIKAGLSKEVAQSEAREEVRETVSKAVTKLQSEQRQLTTRRVTVSQTEVSAHEFNNMTADSTCGKYFYVSKVVEGQVFSYGKRVQVEALIPSPHALYEHLEQVKMMRGFKPACVPAVVLPKDITVEDYEKYLTKYCIASLPKPPVPPAPFTEGYSFSADPGEKHGWDDFGGSGISVPDHPGYFIEEFWITSMWSDPKSGSMAYQVEVFVGSEEVFRRWDKDDNLLGSPSSRDAATGVHLTGAQTIHLKTENINSFNGGITIKWSPLPVDLLPWQTQICDIVNAANRDAIQGAEFAEYKRNYEENRLDRHPFADKEIMMAEIKRAAIYMMCQDFERGGVMNMQAEPCGYPEINRTAAAKECWDWYFWERAFDWRLMSFIFYDYFWNAMCRWPEKFDPGHPNFMFNAFLRAGFMRVQIPAAPGMDADVAHYLETGEKWGGLASLPYTSADPRWISVVDEIKRSHDCYQNDREGMMTGILDANGNRTNQMLLTGTDRYWDPLLNAGAGGIDLAAIADDVDRQIFIGGLAYRIQGIILDPLSPPYSVSGPSLMQWIVTLERVFEGAASIDPITNTVFPQHAHAVGAEFIGAPFRWEEPTQLVWLGDGQNKCLPTYPIKC